MKRLIPAFLFAALAATVSPWAAPDAAAQSIDEVRIYARSLDTGADYAWVNPGGTLVLPPGVELRLRLEAIPRGGGPRYPSGRFDDATMREASRDARRRGITGSSSRDSHRFAGIKGTNTAMGSAVLQTYGREGESAIRYTILDNGLTMPATLRTGTFFVRVDADARLAETLPETAPPIFVEPGPVAPDAARALVAELYRGILMREPEPQGLEDWSEQIQGRGYPEAIAAAMSIAASEESRVRIYRQVGTTHEERLTALYEHLLGIEPRSVDPDRWRADLERLRRGEVEQVVGEMVRSAEFRRRFDFSDNRAIRTRG